MTLSREGKRIVYSYDKFKQIYETCYDRDSGKAIYCVDDNNNIHSGLFVVWDQNSAYDLISTIDPQFRNSGSASLLIREIIRYVSSKTRKFDFEGSMIESVEQSFRRFGAIQRRYFRINKVDSRLLRLHRALKEL